MTVFNTFWKVIKKYKGFIILFTVILVAFGGINTQTTNAPTTYADTKPDILIVNNDENKGLTKNLVTYLTKNSNVDDAKVISRFYQSKLYQELADEKSKLWHYSPMTLYTMYQDELLTGSYDYPEEA